MFWHIVLANNTTTLTNNSRVSLVRHGKFYEVICIINFKSTLFKGFTRGGPWASSLVKQNLNRTQNHEVFTACGRNGWIS
jgi:hypothetical protein